MLEEKNILNDTINIHLQYLVNLPYDYYDSDNNFPLILFLHGAGERGSNIEDIKKYGLLRALNDREIPFIIVSPQCPKDHFWDMHIKDLLILIDRVNKDYRVDNNKIYLVGISMGAVCAWNFGMQFPDIFSAIVPIAGGASLPNYAEKLKNIPIWSFHGKLDKAVPVEKSRKMLERLKAIGGNIKYTEVASSGHELCTTAFESDDIFEWLLEQKK